MTKTNGQEVKKPGRLDVWTGKINLKEAIRFDKEHNHGCGLHPGTILMAEADFEEWAKAKCAIPGFIILVTKPGINAYHGLIERSFDLHHAVDRTQLHWTGTGHSNFGTVHKVDGRQDAEDMIENFRNGRPDWDFDIYDAHDEDALPVVLDWNQWAMACRPAATLSGVLSKYGARNIQFTMKE